jgi:hypothetical protein
LGKGKAVIAHVKRRVLVGWRALTRRAEKTVDITSAAGVGDAQVGRVLGVTSQARNDDGLAHADSVALASRRRIAHSHAVSFGTCQAVDVVWRVLRGGVEAGGERVSVSTVYGHEGNLRGALCEREKETRRAESRLR